MPPSLLPPSPEELEELRQRRRASQLKGYGEGSGMGPLREAADVGRGLFGAQPITPGGEGYRTGQALANMPAVGLAAVPGKVASALPDVATGLGALGAAGVIKPKGGNWLAGSFSAEKALGSLKRHQNPEQELAYIRSELEKPQKGDVYNQLMARLPLAERSTALNKWIDTKLTKYVKNEMATPEDPVRALAERGTLHVQPENLIYGRRTVHPSGEITSKLGTSETAKAWENAADYAITPAEARTYLHTRSGETGEPTLARNPWLAKMPPETPVYDLSVRGSEPSDLGFPHIIDELTNAMNPNSGLPASLRLTPQQLEKVTVPQAVERVAKINEWRAAQKAEADALKARNPATFEHRAYETVPGTTEPNEKGLRWVELRASTEPVDVSSMLIQNAGKYSILEPGQKLSWKDPKTGRVLFDTPEKAAKAYTEHKHYASLEDALKYEGETMKHCVGGYCLDIIEGHSRIYSLRDKKGEPHVTIEVQPGPRIFDTGTPEGRPGPENIAQIKGKGNRAPKDEYLPFVQDFVRSGQWSTVGDLKNTGLIAIDRGSDLAAAMKAENATIPQYVTQEEFTELLRKYKVGTYGYKRGGAVELKDGGKVKAPANPNEPEVRGLPDPRLDNLQIYAQTVSREMFPKDAVKRDAARHIIASSILAQKLNPSLARGLGQGYELVNAPMAHIKSALGMGPVPAGYEMDTVNNALGSEMPFTTQAELQRNARQAIESGRARLTPDEAQPYRRGGRVKIEKHPTLMADELLFKGHRK